MFLSTLGRLRLSLDIVEPVEISVSGRKIPTACLRPRPWWQLHIKANRLVSIPSWKRKRARVCVHACDWLDF